MTLAQSIFATEVAGPMIFTFDKVFSFEKKKLSEDIQSNGGKVVEYSERNEHTIVLTKPNKRPTDEIQFDMTYIKDCLKMRKILPLETYRLDKTVKVGCYYSQPFGSKRCIYARLILQGKCKKHKCVPTDQRTKEAGVNSNDEYKIIQQLELLENLIYVERKPQVKAEPYMPEDSMEEAQESQSFDESPSLLRKV